MTFEEIKNIILNNFGSDAIVKEDTLSVQPQLTVVKERLLEICTELYKNPQTYFDFLSCLTAIDNGPSKGTMEVLYHLYSIPYNHSIVLKRWTGKNFTFCSICYFYLEVRGLA